jgi:asparagine synthase (glutamine-hydrolysing)
LRDWAEALLDERRLREEGFFNPLPIRAAWESQQRGEASAFKLWPTLIFQSWLETQNAAGSEADRLAS